MKDFSGSFKNPFLKEEEISTQSPDSGIEMLNEFDANKNIEEENINTSNNQNNIFQKNEDNEEIEYVMNSMEKLRINHPESFDLVINTTKEIMDIVNKKELKGKELVKKLDSLFLEVEKMDIDYLFWCSHKCLKVAILEQHNIDLVHFFIIKKGFNLSNRAVHKNLINEYLKSFSGVDFINDSQEEITKYVYLLQMLINQGKCDVNDNFDDPVRNSPLHYCIVFNQLQFFIILLKFKYTNINKINLNGDTPLDFACENVIYNHEYYLNKEFAKLLIQHGGKTNNMTHKYQELMKILIDDGEEIENKNKEKKEILVKNTEKTKENKNKEINTENIKKNNEKENISSCKNNSSSIKEENIINNKTNIIGNKVLIEKTIEDKDNKDNKKEIEEKNNNPKLCTKNISF